LTPAISLPILAYGKENAMSDTIKVGEDGRLTAMDDSLPEPPDHDAEVDGSDQPEPEEVDDAVLDE
jgi:hypothetical protein